MPEILFPCGNETAFEIGIKNMPALQELLERCEDYFILVEGQPPKPDDAFILASECPSGWSLDTKILFGINDQENNLVAVLEGTRDYPEECIFWIGLLLIDPSKRGHGLGERIYKGFEEWSRSQGADQIRLGVVEENIKALRFWQRIGFEQFSKSELVLGQKNHVILQMKKGISPHYL